MPVDVRGDAGSARLRRRRRVVIGSGAAPYINSLAASYGLATNYYAASHPSLPNYLALTAGSTFGITSDCTTCFVNATNIADQIEASGRSWRRGTANSRRPAGRSRFV